MAGVFFVFGWIWCFLVGLDKFGVFGWFWGFSGILCVIDCCGCCGFVGVCVTWYWFYVGLV